MHVDEAKNDNGPLRSAENGALYFLHIPKTAGTSVTEWLRNRVKRGSLCPAKNWDQLVMIEPQALMDYRVFAGHFGMDLELFLGQKMTTVTVLRDPLSRTISHYRHVRRDPEHPLHRSVLDQSFETFVMGQQNWPMIENFQARYLVASPIAFKRFASLYDLNVKKRNRLSVLSEDARYLLDPKYVRDKALEAIGEQLAFVGTDECLPNFLRKVGEATLSSLPVSDVPRENIAPPDDIGELSALALEIVYSLTKIDQEIYASVRSHSPDSSGSIQGRQ